MEDLILKVLKHITTSDASERYTFSREEVNLLITKFNAYYCGVGFRVLTNPYHYKEQPQSWSLYEENAVQGCRDCLPIGYPNPLLVYTGEIEGLELEILLNKLESESLSGDIKNILKHAQVIVKNEKEIIGWVVGEVKLLREEAPGF